MTNGNIAWFANKLGTVTRDKGVDGAEYLRSRRTLWRNFSGASAWGGGAVVVKIPCGDEEFFGHGELRGPNFMSHAYTESPFKIWAFFVRRTRGKRRVVLNSEPYNDTENKRMKIPTRQENNKTRKWIERWSHPLYEKRQHQRTTGK